MDKEQAVEKVRRYAETVRQNFPVRKIILCGSYARGAAKEGSDIDVAVVLRCFDEAWLLSRAKLFKLRRDIEPMIEPVPQIPRTKRHHAALPPDNQNEQNLSPIPVRQNHYGNHLFGVSFFRFHLFHRDTAPLLHRTALL